MKKATLTMVSLLAGAILGHQSFAADPPAAEGAAATAATNTVMAAAATNASSAPAPARAEDQAPAATPAPEPSPAPPPAPPVTLVNQGGTNGLVLNLHDAPLDLVLSNLSAVAGYIIVAEAQPRGRVNLVSYQPVSREEAVDLLNAELNKNGYAAIRKGRRLLIVNKDEAKTKALPVRTGSDPEGIPDNEEMVTQILPVRFVEAGQLIKDLQPLVSPQTVMTANESGNSVIITDTQSNIRRIAEVLRAIDSSAEDVTVVKVFHLAHASPSEMADLLTSLFPDDSRSGGTQSPVTFGGFGGFRRFFGGPPGSQASSSGNANSQRIKKRNRIVAVPDQRTGSVIVTAAKELMDQIEGVVLELDADPANQNAVAVMRLENADPQQAMQVLQDLFNKSGTTTSNNRNQQNQNNVLNTRAQQQQNQQNTIGVGSGNRMNTGLGR